MNNQDLINVINEAVNLEGDFSNEILSLMLNNLGSLDPVLRDETIYIGFCKLLGNNVLSKQQKLYILDYIISNETLYRNISIETSDDVFLRSFTSLLLVLLILNHIEHAWLSDTQERTVIQMSLKYLISEKDNRGLDETKGWAHAFAHGADLLGAISQLNLFTSIETKQALEVLRYSLIDVENFLYGEEGRLAKATTEMLINNKLEASVLSDWIDSCSSQLSESGSYNLCWINYLKSLHFNIICENVENNNIEDSIQASISSF